jgi:hypothetical protein
VALIFNRVSLDGRQFGDLVPLRFPGSLHLLNLRRQRMTAVLALVRQDGPNLVDFGDGYQGPMRSAMAGLSTGLPPAFLAPATLSRFPGQSIGGRRFGRVRRVLFAKRQLSLQLHDLLLGIGDLLLAIGYFTAEFFVLSPQTLIFPMQFLMAGFVGVPVAIRRFALLPCAVSRSRTHPP